MNKLKLYVLMLIILSAFSINVMAEEVLVNFIGMHFVKIPSGEFVMGLTDRDEALIEMPDAEENALLDELPAHKVVISTPFFLGQTEVTQKQWYRVMENKPGNVSLWQQKGWENLPVSSISWFMAARFVEELNAMDKAYQYRLPSEAEWEFVAREGSNELRPVDEGVLADYVWYIDNSKDKVQAVATRKANAYGVYDMLGNLWEWVDDWYAKDIYKQKNRIDPQGPQQGWSRVRRGGSYHCPIHMIRPGYRSANKPSTQYEVTGFRVVMEVKE